MVERSHGRRRDPDRPTRRGPSAVVPARPWSRLVALAVVGLSLFGVAGSMAAPQGSGSGLTVSSLRESAFDNGMPTHGWLPLIGGVVALLVGLFVVARCSIIRVPGANLTRIGLGFAITGQGVAQLTFSLSPEPSALSALIGLSSLLIAVIALLWAPRSSSTAWPRLRLVLDSLAVGGASGFVFWQLVIASGRYNGSGHGLGACLVTVADTTVLALVALSAVTDVRARLWPAAIGMFLHAVGDVVIVMHSPVAGFLDAGLVQVVLGSLAWPLIGIGVIRYGGPNESRARARAMREAATAQLAAVAVVVLVMVGVLAGGRDDLDITSLVLLAEVLVLLCLRELVDSLLQLQLTTGLREQAFRDSLTGLPNRRALVEQVVSLQGRPDGWVVLTVDVDRFKEINDVLGHQAGDGVLMAVAKVLRREQPPDATAYRIGGDEFAVLARGGLEEGRKLAYLLQDRLRPALDVAAPGVFPAASVGVGRLVRGRAEDQENALGGISDRKNAGWSDGVWDGRERRRIGRHPLDRPEFAAARAKAARAEAARAEGAGDEGVGSSRHELIALVESAAALRAAKAAGPGSVEVYSGQVAADRERRMLLEAKLRNAVANGGIRTVAQPIVALATGKVSGFEALARWRDDELGDISPVEFIAIAEQTGLVVELGRQVLVGSIEQAATVGVFAAGCSVSINVSPIQLRVPGFVDLMSQQLRRHDVRAELVVVEVTEAIMVTEDDPALRTLAELNALGVRVAIDDFGTGYSALGYLRRLPVQILKIDRSLTVNLMSEPRTLAIVEGVVRMAHRMGIRVTMEGIEDELEARSCRGVEADLGQGWLFGRPTEWFQVADALRNGAGETRSSATGPEPDLVALLPAQRPQGEVPVTEEPGVQAGH